MKIKEQIGSMLVKGIAKTFGLSEGARLFLTGADLNDEGNASAIRPYHQVSLVFSCINKLISSIMGLPLVLSTIDEKIIESGPAYELLFNNPELSWSRFVYESIGNYALYRDVFWIFPEDSLKELLIVPGKQMHAKTSNNRPDGALIGWEFHGLGGQTARFTPDEVWQWKNFNPYDRFHGLGPAKAAEVNINYTYAAELLNTSALANGAELGIILSFPPGSLSDDQIKVIREQFDNRQVGPAKARKTAVITGGAKVESAANSMADLEVAKLTEMSDKKICSAFEVPPGVAGLITEAQYSHGPAMRDFIFNSIIPLATLFAEQITSGILNRFSSSKLLNGGFDGVDKSQAKYFCGFKMLSFCANKYFRYSRTRAIAVQGKAFAWFDATQHPVVQEATREASDKLINLAKYVPFNNINEVNDLPYEPTEAGKYVWKNMGEVPADYILEAGPEGIISPPYPGNAPDETPPPEVPAPGKSIENQETKTDDARRLRIWNNWTISWAGIEREYREALRILFVHQQNFLIKILRSVMVESKSMSEQRATPEEIIARVVFDLKIEDNNVRVINHTFFKTASELGIRQVFSEVAGLAGDKLNEQVERAKHSTWLRGKLLISTQKITGINRTTQKFVANQLKQGLEAGETVNDLASRIRRVLGDNRGRALNIARTQTAGAVGSGRHTGMKSAGIELKSWLTAGDENVRSAHRDAGKKYAEGIAVDLPFIVDGESLMFPGDPSGSAGNIINCRCVELARRAGARIFDLIYYDNHPFYSYSDMQRDKLAA
jgi:HK97 family phage portal protein